MPRRTADPQLLTARERDVLQLAAFGLSNRLIAERLGIAEQTVKNHIGNAMRKLEIHDRTHAVVVAIGQGWIGLPVDSTASDVEMDVIGHVAEQRVMIRRRA